MLINSVFAEIDPNLSLVFTVTMKHQSYPIFIILHISGYIYNNQRPSKILKYDVEKNEEGMKYL